MTTIEKKIELTRTPDWPYRLNEYINSVKDTPFEYGVHDCCTFAAGVIKSMTGVDIMEEFRGTYQDQASAAKVIKEKCVQGSLFETIVEKLGPPVIGAKGRRGDIAWFEGNCGVVLGRNTVFFADGGYVLILINKIEFSFRVG